MKKVDGGSNVPLLSPFFFSFFFLIKCGAISVLYEKRNPCPLQRIVKLSFAPGISETFPSLKQRCFQPCWTLGLFIWFESHFPVWVTKKKSYPETHFCTSRGQTTGWLSTHESRECVLAKSPALLWLLSQATNHKWKRKEKKRDILDSRKKKISFCFQASVNYDISKTCSLHCFL